MALSKNAVPASVRTPKDSEVLRAGTQMMAKPFLVAAPRVNPLTPKLVARVDAIAGSVLRARAVRLPQEPEDAKLTGSTRSLNRRLMGLNLGGSLLRPA